METIFGKVLCHLDDISGVNQTRALSISEMLGLVAEEIEGELRCDQNVVEIITPGRFNLLVNFVDVDASLLMDTR